MSEDIEAVAPVEEQKRGGSTAAKVIGGAAGGAGMAALVNPQVVKASLRKSLAGDKGASDSMNKAVKELLEKEASVLAKHESDKVIVESLKDVKLTDIASVEYIEVAGKEANAAKTYTLKVTKAGQQTPVVIKEGITELPKDVKAGDVIKGDTLKTLVDGEKSHVGKAIDELKKATEKTGKELELTKNAKAWEVVNAAKAEDILSIKPVHNAEKKIHDLYVEIKGVEGTHVLANVKADMPKTITNNTVYKKGEEGFKLLHAEEKGFLKTTALKESESALLKGMKEAGIGFKKLGGGGKATVIAGVVAGVGAGAYILNAVFSPRKSHVERLETQPVAQGQAMGA